jgi:hypothetical protein
MVAKVAFLDRGRFIVLVVSENRRWSFRAFKNLVINGGHVFL